MEMCICTAPVEINIGGSSKNKKIKHDPAIPLLSRYPKE
jgi:hypothetical protein